MCRWRSPASSSPSAVRADLLSAAATGAFIDRGPLVKLHGVSSRPGHSSSSGRLPRRSKAVRASPRHALRCPAGHGDGGDRRGDRHRRHASSDRGRGQRMARPSPSFRHDDCIVQIPRARAVANVNDYVHERVILWRTSRFCRCRSIVSITCSWSAESSASRSDSPRRRRGGKRSGRLDHRSPSRRRHGLRLAHARTTASAYLIAGTVLLFVQLIRVPLGPSPRG